MTEWPNVPALRAGVSQGTAGSNPVVGVPSFLSKKGANICGGGGVVKRASLESLFLHGNASSNLVLRVVTPTIHSYIFALQ